MMKCATCGKPITNPYYLDGKRYGYNCYRMALSLKLARLEEEKNQEWAIKCLALIAVFEQRAFKDSWNRDFQKSILNQWNECHKLTANQFNCIYKKFTDTEKMEHILTTYALTEDAEKRWEIVLHICGSYTHSDQIKEFAQDERLHAAISERYARAMSKGKRYFIVASRDVDEEEIMYSIEREREVREYQEDEDTEISMLIEIA